MNHKVKRVHFLIIVFSLIKDKSETLLIWGEKDYDTPLCDAIKMNSIIADSGLIIIKNGTHFSYLDAPFYINKIIIEFIN